MHELFDHPECPQEARSRRRAQLAFLAMFLAAAIGCADPFAGQYTNAKVAAPDMVGKYAVSDWYGTATSSTPSAVCAIDLRADGTCTVTPCAPADGTPSTVEGTWSLEKCQSDQAWTCLRISAPGISSSSFHLTGDQPPFDLMTSFGDADTGDACRLKKAVPSTP